MNITHCRTDDNSVCNLSFPLGLTYMRKHAETGEGCTLLQRHDVVMCLLKVYDNWKSKPGILLFCISILRKMLDCNFTRDLIIERDGPGYTQASALRLSFAILHSHMDSVSHVDESMRLFSTQQYITCSFNRSCILFRCIMQCARSESCRQDIIERRIIVYASEVCRMYSKNPEILRSVITLFSWTANTMHNLKTLCDLGAV
jgi:hypothetical protein